MLNVVALMGRLTADPELKHTRDNLAVTSFTIAVDRGYVRQGCERQADFFTIVCWRSLAEFVCKYFKKGQLMAVNGSIQTRKYEDNNGNKRTAFEIIADNINFAGGKEPQIESHLNEGYSQNVGDFEEITEDVDIPEFMKG